jgi:hypothetical protein
MSESKFLRSKTVLPIVTLVVVVVALAMPEARHTIANLLGGLRVQKVQAVNVDFTSLSDPNSNPELHQMVSQMISDKAIITTNDKDQPVENAAAATQAAGFPPRLISARKDEPVLVVGGQRALMMTVDRARLHEIIKASGHPELALPESLDGASFSVQIPRTIRLRYGKCPVPQTAGKAITNQVVETPASTADYADCLRLTEGPVPNVNVPAGLDVRKLAEVGLQVAGMTPQQSREFFQTIDWRATLTLTVPRQLRSYEQVEISGTKGTLLTLAGRRGPGYTLVWVKNGIAFALTGYGDPGHAVEIADSVQ